MSQHTYRVEPVAKASIEPISEKVAQLKILFPEIVSEGKVDIEKLRCILDEHVNERTDRYNFTWSGKQQAIGLLQTPSLATLIPVPHESINFDTTNNLFIEGDNLEVLKLLQKSFYGQVKMIYIDPPYNTGNDFIYPDNYNDPLDNYLKVIGQKDDDGNYLTSKIDKQGRYHSKWLSMMYPRLFLARQLLSDDGVICVSIGDEELHDLRMIMNEIFGEENHRNTLAIRRYDKNLSRQFMDQGLTSLSIGFEYVLIYARSQTFTMNPVFREASAKRQVSGYWKGFLNAADRPTMRYPLLGVEPESGQWKWQKSVAEEAVENYKEYLNNFAEKMSLEDYWDQTGRKKRFIRRNPNGKAQNGGVDHWIPPSNGILRSSNWTDILASESLDSLPFDSPKNVELLKNLIRLCCDEDDLVLDFFAGSCTTAYAVLDLNHYENKHLRFVVVQLQEKTDIEQFPAITDVGKERIRQVINQLQFEARASHEPQGQEIPEDLGYRVFRLSHSNYKHWVDVDAKDSRNYVEQMAFFNETLIPDWQLEQVIWEVALKEGYDLNAFISRVEAVEENAVYRVFDSQKEQSFIICLDDDIKQTTLDALNICSNDLFVCRDIALDDEKSVNFALRCRLKTM